MISETRPPKRIIEVLVLRVSSKYCDVDRLSSKYNPQKRASVFLKFFSFSVQYKLHQCLVLAKSEDLLRLTLKSQQLLFIVENIQLSSRRFFFLFLKLHMMRRLMRNHIAEPLEP